MPSESAPNAGKGERTDEHISARPSKLAFEHLNLHRNPFGQPPEDAWPDLVIADVERFVEQLRRPATAIQFIGKQGRGKSTHMRAIHAYFPGAPFVYFGPGERPEVPHGEVLFLDETQRIPWWRREWIFRRRDLSSLVIGTHRSHASQLSRLGFSVETVEVGGLTTDTLRAIVDRRIEWARREDGPVPRLSAEALQALVDRYGDDLRSIEELLYERFQTLETIGHVDVKL